MKKRSALVLIVLTMLSMVWPAAAEWKQKDLNAYTDVASPGMTIMPQYNDFSHNFGNSYTQSNFDITYSTTEEDVTVDETGLVTVGENALYKQTYIDVTYTRKGYPRQNKTFQESIYVIRPLKKLELSEDEMCIPITSTRAAVTVTMPGVNEVWQAVDYALYDDSMMSILPAEVKYGTHKGFDFIFVPKAVGDTYIKFVSYNGIIKVLPVHVVSEMTKLEFGIDHVYCEPGDVIDLGIDLGNGEYGPAAYASLISHSARRDGTFVSVNPWLSENRFVAEIGGEYTLSMAHSGFERVYAYITVYDDAACADIRLSDDLTQAGATTAEILVYDADGNQLQRPVSISQEGKVVTFSSGKVTKEKTGVFTVNVTNPDGSVFSKTFETQMGPTVIGIGSFPRNLKYGDTFEVDVSFDVEGEFDYTLTYSCWNYDFNGPQPIRIEGNKVIVQAYGQAEITASYGGLSARKSLYVYDDSGDVWLEFLPERTAVGVPTRAVVVDADNMLTNATFTCAPDAATISADGYITPLKAGSIAITATTEDGRVMERNLTVTAVPVKISIPNLVIKEGGAAWLPTITTEPGGVSSWALTISVEDTSIATYDAKEKRFWAVSPGVTTGIVRCNYNNVEARFIIEVVSNELYIGSTDMSVPYGFYAYLPAVTDAKGKEVKVNWAITQENLAADNPNASAFVLEDNTIACIWPEGSCIVTGTTEDDETVKVKVTACRIAEEISIAPAVVEVPLGEKVQVKVVNEDPGTMIPNVYWVAETEQIVTFKETTTALTNSLYGYKAGTTRLMALLDNGAYALCEVKVVDPIPRIPGDTNDDGVVDAKDALIIMQYDAGWNVSINGWQGDVNADGKTNMDDALMIFQHNAGLEVQLKQYIPAE